MKILYCGMEFDYGEQARGRSFEHYNFYESLCGMGHDLLYFDFMELERTLGREAMNRRLLETVRAEKPDVLFTILFQDQIRPETIREISDDGVTKTVNWFCDDHWRFENFSQHWAPNFHYVVTTASSALPKYRAIGYENVIKSQWACNHDRYRKLDLPHEYDVTFVGQPHGTRRGVIEALRQAGIRVRVWGNGWPEGRVTQEEMIRIFNQSRINLNLSNASVAQPTAAAMPRPLGNWFKRKAAGALRRIPYGGKIKQLLKSQLWEPANVSAQPQAAPLDQPLTSQQGHDQIKGRNFEVPGCGGCLLTGRADDLHRYYDVGTEVLCFGETVGDLIAQIRTLLKDEAQCRAVAEAGYRRTLAEHTYAHRFEAIFRQMGCTEAALAGTQTG